MSMPDRLTAVASFRRQLAGFAPGADSARHALRELRTVAPFDHASLSAWDPIAKRHRTLANSGYPDKAMLAIDDGMHLNRNFTMIRRSRIPLQLSEVPAEMRTGAIFDRVIGPMGYRGGLTHCLHGVDGRYVGMINISSYDTLTIDQTSAAVVALLSEGLANLLDPVGAPLNDRGCSTAIVHSDGSIQALTDDARVDLLTGQLLELATSVASGRVPSTRRTVVCKGEVVLLAFTPVRGGTLVGQRFIEPPCGLTIRELEVLCHLPSGASNAVMGDRLSIGASTVASHVERILRKTRRPNRTGAATFATELGLVLHS